jgi:hypothetical protein
MSTKQAAAVMSLKNMTLFPQEVARMEETQQEKVREGFLVGMF